MMGVLIYHVVTTWALTWFSGLVVVVAGQLTASNILEDLLQSTLVVAHDQSVQPTPLLETSSSATGSVQVISVLQTPSSSYFSFASIVLNRTQETSFALRTKEDEKKQTTTSQPTMIYQHVSIDSDVTSTSASVPSNYLTDLTVTTSFLSPEVRVLYTRTPELELMLFTTPTSQTSLTKKVTSSSSSAVLDVVSTSTVDHTSSTQIELWSIGTEKHHNSTKVTPAITGRTTPSSIHVTSKPESTTRPSARTWARKPAHVGASGQSTDTEIFGRLTTGAKIAIGVVISLCLLGVVVAGVVGYRRYCFGHTNHQPVPTSSAQYKDYNDVGDKMDETALISAERR